MARRKQQPEFVSPEFFQASRSKFIGYVDRFCNGAIKQLQTEVLPGKMTVRQWAEQFGVAGTWIEHWAQEVIKAWQAGRNIHAGKYLLLHPVVKPTAADYFTFRIPRMIPPSKAALGVTRGGSVRDEYQNLTDWEANCRDLHGALDRALDEHLANPAKRTSREVIIPRNLDQCLQKLAVRYFDTMTTRQISELAGSRADVTTTYRHMQQAILLLDLPPLPKGRPKKK
jgi:hypothetical protein